MLHFLRLTHESTSKQEKYQLSEQKRKTFGVVRYAASKSKTTKSKQFIKKGAIGGEEGGGTNEKNQNTDDYESMGSTFTIIQKRPPKPRI